MAATLTGIWTRSLRILCVAFVLLAFVTASTFADGMQYTITDLGALIPGATASSTAGINSLGQVLVNSNAGSYIYSGGTMTSLGNGPFYGINNSQNLSTPFAGFTPGGINNSGIEVGILSSASLPLGVAASELNGAVTPISGYPGSSQGRGINDSGQIVGVFTSSDGDHPFIYSNGHLTDIGANFPQGVHGAANAINNLGQVVGQIYGGHAFLYSNGTLIDLGTLGGSTVSDATAINNKGQIIGMSGTDAFLYQDGKMMDMTDLIYSLGGIKIEGLEGINDSGQITADAIVAGQVHAFLLTPSEVPEPTTFVLMAAGGAALIARGRRRGPPQEVRWVR